MPRLAGATKGKVTETQAKYADILDFWAHLELFMLPAPPKDGTEVSDPYNHRRRVLPE